ncbi:HET-domain-containing protein [Trametes versicolor FP-101664 SS1]|uniref:HET-domain-containing protein n=1 Tax=Trametes versicolor (strain FP-101664) TaxID=717944 RepID=UPI000462342F|nr:HET-domain-containing protein [Trametes versicolor FP-101664 SS1]EIW57634.1 HET-domain-containing protein [Trametes versicolor FP-101664 SS1]
MRLLDTHTGAFVWINNPSDVRYAILSHTWSPDGEQPYQDLLKIQAARDQDASQESQETLQESQETSFLDDPAVSYKIRGACAAAREDGYAFIWIDSCCIDQSSSAELSEAINSMFEWYRMASVCYAYLSDVEDDDDVLAEGSQFACSRWHTRGWTLQELLAPAVVVFLTQRWNAFGTKTSLADILERITGIDRAVLTGEATLDSVSVARRMSWAATRTTTRPEDEAYALMGLFDVSLPTIYGEGRRAFLRLQEEILRNIPDQSILAWRGPLTRTTTLPCGGWGLLARSPADFEHAADITPVSDEDFAARLGLPFTTLLPGLHYALTPHGVRTRFYAAHARHLEGAPAFVGCPARDRTLDAKGGSAYDFCAILPCQDGSGRLVALPLCVSANPGTPGLLVGTCREGFAHCAFTARTFALDPDDIGACLSLFTVMELCVQLSLAHAPGRGAGGQIAWTCSPTAWTRLKLAPYPWCSSVLSRQGYRLTYDPPTHPRAHERTHIHVLKLQDRAAHDSVSIHIDFVWHRQSGGSYVFPAFRVLYHPRSYDHSTEGGARESQALACACGAETAHSHVSLTGSQEVARSHYEFQHAPDISPGALHLTLAREHRLDKGPDSDFWLTIEVSGTFFAGPMSTADSDSSSQ